MAEHEIFMQRALDLALLGIGKVSPNPMVGAVIVLEGKVIGEGYHERYGEAHAEVNAVRTVLEKFDHAGQLLKKSTMYVTLEPCAHFGKTPPCADLIVAHQIHKVVIGCRDSFSEVNGKGIEKLKKAGIEVIEGILEEECLKINKRFFTRISQQRPYVILKWAQTANGYFAPGDSSQRWITGKEAKILSHQWRTEEDCVLVGKRTAAIDNPQLNARLFYGRNPKRAVIDRNLELERNLFLFDQSQDTFVFNKEKTSIEGQITYIGIEDFDSFLPQYILYQLYLQDIQSVIIEGGVSTLKQFIDTGLWDEARLFIAPESWVEGIPAPQLQGHTVAETTIGKDCLFIIHKQLQK